MGDVISMRAMRLAAFLAAAAWAMQAEDIAPAQGAERVEVQLGAQEPPDGVRLPPELARLLGTWRGTYHCAQGVTGLTLTVGQHPSGGVLAEFRFYPVSENPGVPSGRYKMAGTFDSKSRLLDLQAGAWIEQPHGYMSVGLKATVDFDAGEMVGTMEAAGCGTLRLRLGHTGAVRSGLPR